MKTAKIPSELISSTAFLNIAKNFSNDKHSYNDIYIVSRNIISLLNSSTKKNYQKNLPACTRSLATSPVSDRISMTATHCPLELDQNFR